MDSENIDADVISVDRTDIVDSGSLPSLMMQYAIENMNKVVETANDIIEAQRKEMILGFITAFLMLVPVVGETIGAVGGSVMRTLINVAGELGNVALGIYDIVDAPDNALMSIFGLLLGGVSLRPFKEVAALRKGMKSTELDALGPVKKNLDRIEVLKTKGKASSCSL